MARDWLYPLRVGGKFRRIKRWAGVVLQAILFVTPWIYLEGRPVLWFDLPGRRLYAFGSMFTATDTIFVVLMGLFGAFSLFFFTALFGRMWCGYACPQTVFLEEWVRPIEEWIEGPRSQRMHRDKGPWNFDKIWRKVAKFAAFLLLSVVVAMSFTSYFVPARELWMGLGGTGAYGVVAFLTFIMFWDFAWFREQFCNYLCPYARFQGALADDESQVIAFDKTRESECINCKKCVAVCPQGIDIREGFQLECISCGLCVDACQSVMDKRHAPNLVHYTTIAETMGQKPRLLRPRTFVYGGLLATIAVAFLVMLNIRHDIQATIGRTPGSLYTLDPDGFVRNTFLLRVTNRDMERDEDTYQVTFDGLPPGAEAKVEPFTLATEKSTVVPVIVRLPDNGSFDRTIPFRVTIASHDDKVVLETTFKSDHPEG